MHHVDPSVQTLLFSIPHVLLSKTLYRRRTSTNSVNDLRLLKSEHTLVANCNQHNPGTPLAVNVRKEQTVADQKFSETFGVGDHKVIGSDHIVCLHL